MAFVLALLIKTFLFQAFFIPRVDGADAASRAIACW